MVTVVEDIFKVKDVSFSYSTYGDAPVEIPALRDVTTSIKKGVVYVTDKDTSIEENIWDIRRTAGMVFQNPDNQIIATTVEEDVAFGPENIGVEPSEIRSRVDEALKIVGIAEFRNNAPHLLSGGQKQRVAIAGILAMKPECIILDEATSMLDPIGRKEVMNVLKKLNEEENITIIHITHHMEEAAMAKRLVIVDKGQIVLDGTPKDVFNNVQQVKNMGLDIPQVTELFFLLKQNGSNIDKLPLTVDEAYNLLLGMLDV